MPEITVLPGEPYPLGAVWDGRGTNFALFSEGATSVELLLFDSPDSPEPAAVIPLKERTAFVWHCYLPGFAPPKLYAYRVDGPYRPEEGLRFNRAKLLLDPYAKAIAGTVIWDDSLFGYRIGDPALDLSRDDRDSSAFVPKCVVVDPSFDWEGDRRLRTPWNETVIYEAHVKGLTARHLGVDDKKRGTFAGLTAPAVVDHLKRLGVTALEMLPVHEHIDGRAVLDRRLTNYWGYNTIGFFAPHCLYSSSGVLGQQVREFKEMVKGLHAAGLEVILDVVYNHTAEGSELGPTLCFRGIDNGSYYRLKAESRRNYMDFTGCGNSLNVSHPRILQLIMDSLRYWILEMHIDGFRFDLASSLARELFEVDRLSSFFDIIQQDPVLSQIKLIAEPWDLGSGGYQVGNFPPLWAEWNGRYRDVVRRFWKGDGGQVSELGYRLTGSSDLYQDDGRNPFASINFVTSHDGLTLEDLVSYNEKHNEANGENNSDGSSDNMSWNCGAEGPATDVSVTALRQRQKKNFLATLFLSQGVPMLLGGDEIGRTQGGNNNAYCQDNEISWFDWSIDEAAREILEFTAELIRIRKDHPVFCRRRFFKGRRIAGSDLKDITWLRPDGAEMSESDWNQGFVHSLGLMLSGEALDEVDEEGRRVRDDTFLLLINGHYEPIMYKIPRTGGLWELVLDSSRGPDGPGGASADSGSTYVQPERSVALFREVRGN